MDHLTNYKKKISHPITCLIDPTNKTEKRDTESMAELLANEFIVLTIQT